MIPAAQGIHRHAMTVASAFRSVEKVRVGVEQDPPVAESAFGLEA